MFPFEKILLMMATESGELVVQSITKVILEGAVESFLAISITSSLEGRHKKRISTLPAKSQILS